LKKFFDGIFYSGIFGLLGKPKHNGNPRQAPKISQKRGEEGMGGGGYIQDVFKKFKILFSGEETIEYIFSIIKLFKVIEEQLHAFIAPR
jgi:hypothetical protein